MEQRQDAAAGTTGAHATQGMTMRAIVQNRYGSPDEVLELREIERPVVGDDEVVVRVHAAGVAIGDWLTVQGMPYIARPGYGLLKPRNRVAGFEMAGTVESIGTNVTEFRPGDEVFGWCKGALAEYVAVSQEALERKPANLSLEQAAVVPTSGFAALQALRDAGRIQQGQEVLILGASGAVGTFAVQIARALGGKVTGVCGTRNLDMVRSIGADRVIDYTREDVTRTGPRYDLVLDLAGNRPLSGLRRTLKPGGTLVIVGGSGGPWTMGFGRTIRATFVSPFVRQQLRPFFSKPNKADLMVLRELIEAGDLTPVIDRTYPLREAADAVAYIGARHTRGKTVITV